MSPARDRSQRRTVQKIVNCNVSELDQFLPRFFGQFFLFDPFVHVLDKLMEFLDRLVWLAVFKFVLSFI